MPLVLAIFYFGYIDNKQIGPVELQQLQTALLLSYEQHGSP